MDRGARTSICLTRFQQFPDQEELASDDDRGRFHRGNFQESDWRNCGAAHRHAPRLNEIGCNAESLQPLERSPKDCLKSVRLSGPRDSFGFSFRATFLFTSR